MTHDVNNSQCDLNQYGPDPGDGSVKCTCDDDPPVESAVRPGALVVTPANHQHISMAGDASKNNVVLTGRAASSHMELRDAGRELRAAQDLYRKAEVRWKAALDAHMLELA